MKSNTMEYYLFDDIEEELCNNMGIPIDKFRDYHEIIYPNYEELPMDEQPYCDLWHVWIFLFGDNIKNDSYDSVWFPLPDTGNKDDNWGYTEEKSVKEYGEWSRKFVKAIEKLVADHDLGDKETVIYYSW